MIGLPGRPRRDAARTQTAEEKAAYFLAQITSTATLSKLEFEEYRLPPSHFSVFPTQTDPANRLSQVGGSAGICPV
jgi:hypothetical protein